MEDIAATRPGIPAESVPEEGLVAWGSTEELRVLGTRAGWLVHWVWRADTDWVAGHAAERAGFGAEHEPDADLLLVREGSGAPHVFTTDGSGTVVHLETGAWRAPEGRVAAVREPRSVRRRQAAAPARGAQEGAGRKAEAPSVAGESGAGDLPLLEDAPAKAPEAAPEAAVEAAVEAALPTAAAEAPSPEAAAPPEEEAKPAMEPIDLDQMNWPPRPGKGGKAPAPETPPAMPPVVWPE